MRLTKTIIVLAALVMAAIVGASVAGALVKGDGDKPEHAAVGQPKPETRAIKRTAKDPKGGRDWALAVTASRDGGTCVDVGRTERGKLGLARDGAFAEKPSDVTDGCGPNIGDSPLYVHAGAKAVDGRLAIHGIVDPSVERVFVARASGGESELALKDGAFLTVVSGDLDDVKKFPLRLVLEDGSSVDHEWMSEKPKPTKPGR